MSARVPVNVLTGFLGSGKTSLLNRLLRDPLFHNCAVLINEFGDIGIDHHLVDRVDGDVVLLQSGCICCTIVLCTSAASGAKLPHLCAW
jgi:G3E family GTPase